MTPLLEIDNLRVTFDTRHGMVTALDSVSLHLNAGETLGVVGESGCGKSITALSVMGLIPQPPGRIAAGSIRLNGEDLVGADEVDERIVAGPAIEHVVAGAAGDQVDLAGAGEDLVLGVVGDPRAVDDDQVAVRSR